MTGLMRIFGGLGYLFLCARICAAQSTGAAVPWTTYEAEHTITNGAVIGPDLTGFTPAREASGRRCVRLSMTGQRIDFKATVDAQGLVVRYSIPDRADGPGQDATLSLFINQKFVTRLAMTSRYSHLYGTYPFRHRPAVGVCRNFWDEVRVMPGEIHPGDEIELIKQRDDKASEYLIDLIDLEKVPLPLSRPEGSLAVTDFGAVGDGKVDDRQSFVRVILAARAQHLAVWIPPGRYLFSGPIEVSDVKLLGAGMWYTTLSGVEEYVPDHRVAIIGKGSDVTVSDMAIVGRLTYRDDKEANDGIVGTFGERSILRNLWVEHTKTGAWLINSDGLHVEGCRFRNTIADGLNLCVGMRNTTVENCSARGTGDDCFAIWPATYCTAVYDAGQNQIVRCTAQLPFLAQGFAMYGGDSNRVENCQAIDIPYGAGALVSTTFPTANGFSGSSIFQNMQLLRTGDEDGGIGLVAKLRDVDGVKFSKIQICDSPRDGVKFSSVGAKAINDVVFDQLEIRNSGTGGKGYGINVQTGTAGSAMFENLINSDATISATNDNAPGFKLSISK